MLVVGLTVLFSCSSTRQPASTIKIPKGCKPVIGENVYFDDVDPVDTLQILSSSGKCYTQKGAYKTAHHYACQYDYALVSLINVKKPSFFDSPCYSAKALFYDTRENYKISRKPIIDLPDQSNKGLALALRLRASLVGSGLQAESGLTSDGGTVSTSKVSIAPEATFYPLEQLGIGISLAFVFAEATAPNTKNMSLFSQTNSHVFIKTLLFSKQKTQGLVSGYLKAGGYFTSLTFDKEYRDFVAQEAYTLLRSDAASGIGYSLEAGIQLLNRNQLLYDFSTSYDVDYPKFGSKAKAIDGQFLMLGFSLGYKF
jgi:hypothetical protein